MKKGFFVSGTDTGAGKTLVSLGLCLHFQGDYWKPVQTGGPEDTDYIRRFLPESRIRKSAYEFPLPLSPNQAAEKEGAEIDLKNISVPQSGFLVAEGAGGALAPLSRRANMTDLMRLIGLPVLIAARSGLGTLNHTLLTIEALRARGLPPAGLILSGEPHALNKRDLEEIGGVPVILEIPRLPKITEARLRAVFQNLRTGELRSQAALAPAGRRQAETAS